MMKLPAPTTTEGCLPRPKDVSREGFWPLTGQHFRFAKDVPVPQGAASGRTHCASYDNL
jgi:hypothetical protein